MKIILSKKGLDSSFSSKGVLIENGDLFFVPIVAKEEEERKYSEIQLNNQSLFDIFNTLVGDKFYYDEMRVELTKDTRCHLDPQLENYFDCENFKGSFGQVNQAQSHLENQGVSIGDMFLFYGWYRKLNDKIHNDGINVIFGYMQVGEIIKTSSLSDEDRINYETTYPWLKHQPHWNKNLYADNPQNKIYIARETCTFDETIKGFGMFDYNPELNLTSNDMRLKSCWKVQALATLKTSCKGANGECNFDNQGRFKAPSRGQELVLEESNLAKEWVENLIKKYAKK